MTAYIVPFFESFTKEVKGFWNIARIAKERRLNFSNQDEFGTNVLALDNRKRKLLFLMQSNEKKSCLIVDLKDLIRCTIKKQYQSIDAGELENSNLDKFLKTIYLNLRFRNHGYDVPIPFFEAQRNKQEDIAYLEGKAVEWKSIVSKLLPVPVLKKF